MQKSCAWHAIRNTIMQQLRFAYEWNAQTKDVCFVKPFFWVIHVLRIDCHLYAIAVPAARVSHQKSPTSMGKRLVT